MSGLRFRVEPRDVPPVHAVRRIGLSLDCFEEILPRLLSRGFPPSDPDTGNYDLDAIDSWRASRHKRVSIFKEMASMGIVAARLTRMRST